LGRHQLPPPSLTTTMTTHRLSSDHIMPTPTLRAANVAGIWAIGCLSLFATIVTAAGFASLITRHIELIFTRDTILPLLMPEITPPPQQTSEPPQDQPASKSLPDPSTSQHPPTPRVFAAPASASLPAEHVAPGKQEDLPDETKKQDSTRLDGSSYIA